MNAKKCLSIFLALIMTISAGKIFAKFNSAVIAGYWTDWSPYWSVRSYPISGSLDPKTGKPIDNLDFDQQMNCLNILYYAFLEADKNGVLQFYDVWSDLSAADASFCQKNQEICKGQIPTGGLGNFKAFSQLRNTFPNLKVIISIGGFNHDETFHYAFANPQNFIQSVIAIIQGYQINGVDLDFEPQEGWTAENVANYIKLVDLLRNELPDSTLSVAATANPAVIKQFDGSSHNWQKLVKNLNYINVMAYDFHGGFDGIGSAATFHSNLYSDSKDPYPVHYSGDAAIQAYLQAGVSPTQLVLGVPAYGRVLGKVGEGSQHGLYKPFGSIITTGDLDGEMQSYYGIISQWLGRTFTDYWYSVGDKLSGIYAYNPSAQQFVSYDNAALIDEKTSYVKKNQLRGMMIWELRADIAPNDPSDSSLIKHMYNGLK